MNEKQHSTSQADSTSLQTKTASLHYRNTATTQRDGPRAQQISVSVEVVTGLALVDVPQEAGRHDLLKVNQTSPLRVKIP